MHANLTPTFILSVAALLAYATVLARARTALLGYALYNVMIVASSSLAGVWIGVVIDADLSWVTPAHIAVFVYTAAGLLAAAIGLRRAWQPLARRVVRLREVGNGTEDLHPSWANPIFVYVCLAIGAVAYLTTPVVFVIPTLSGVVGVLRQFLTVGVLVAVYYGRLTGEYKTAMASAVVFMVLALASTLLSGHVGAFLPTITQGIIIFIMTGRRRMRRLLIAVPMLIPLGAIYVGWLGTRGLIRQGTLEDETFTEASRDFLTKLADESDIKRISREEFFDAVMYRIDNSTLLAAQVVHQPAEEPYAYGKTVTEDLASALIPRAFWPEKPIKAGGTDFVSKYTGLSWEGIQISVGLPYQFELYANGGPWLVIVGLFAIGWLTGYLELRLFRNPRSLRRLLPLWTTVAATCTGGERFYLTIMGVIAGGFGAYVIGILIETMMPDIAARALNRGGQDASVIRHSTVPPVAAQPGI